MYNYGHPYVVYPYYQPQRMNTVPVNYAPVYRSDSLQNTVRQQNHYPPVDIQQLDESVRRFQGLMKQANLLLTKLVNDPVFAKELMSEAQQSNTTKVDELIKSTGITIDIETSFTPTGIRIILANSEIAGQCCELLIALRW
ncbi:hypothetical protein [Oceanobacillus sp. Castelsardo]|uniref:hypothetical protein n=1 Tax=Oceanobacillus sp. Castelsardo TaxID=1851204 RepID=UPI0009EEC028|nr:hypothetical protein [Oceanobacillus sp. Castelsardo]